MLTFSATPSPYNQNIYYFTPSQSGIYRVQLTYHNVRPLELRVGYSVNYDNSLYIANQPDGNLGRLNIICYLEKGTQYSIGGRYGADGAFDNDAGYIQLLFANYQI